MECKRIMLNRRMAAIFLFLLFVTAGVFLYQQGKKDTHPGMEMPQESYEELQRQYVREYPEYLERILDQGNTMSGISIFQDTDSYSYRNVQKITKAYEGLKDIRMDEGNYEGFESVMKFEPVHYVIALFGFILVWMLFEDEKKGLWSVSYASPAGRSRLALRRLGALALGNALFVAASYLVMMALGLVCYGNVTGWGSSIQSVPLFQNCTLSVSIGGYFLLFLFLRAAMAFAFSVFVWAVLLVFRNHVLSAALLIGVVAAEGIMSTGMSDHSVLVVLKYANLFRLIYPGDILYSYRNYNLMKYPANCFQTLLFLILIVVAVAGGICIRVSVKRRPCTDSNRLEQLLLGCVKRLAGLWHQMIARLSFIGLELYKLLVVQKGLVFLVVWAAILIQQLDTEQVFLMGQEVMLQEAYEGYTGPDDGRLRSYVSKRVRELADMEERYGSAIVEFQNGTIDKEKLDAVSAVYGSYETLRGCVTTLYHRLDYMQQLRDQRDIDVWFLDSKGYQILWTADGMYQGQGYGRQESRAVLAVILVILLFGTIFSYDHSCGMETVIRSTPSGRSRLLHRKTALACAVCLLICAVTYGLELYEAQQIFPMSGWSAPVQSLEFMRDYPLTISIRGFWLITQIIHFLILCSITMIVYFLSMYLGGIKGIAAGILLLLIPEAGYMLGFDWCRYISVIQPMMYVEALEKNGFWGSMLQITAVLVLGAVCGRLVRRRWCR